MPSKVSVLLVAITLATVTLSISAAQTRGDERETPISLALKAASAERGDEDVTFRFEVTIDNATGKEVITKSAFSSIFDGLDLIVMDADGKLLVRQGYTFHQSPVRLNKKKFILKPGKTSGVLLFPVRKSFKVGQVLKVRLDGTLPNSPYTKLLSTNTKEIRVERRKRDGGESAKLAQIRSAA